MKNFSLIIFASIILFSGCGKKSPPVVITPTESENSVTAPVSQNLEIKKDNPLAPEKIFKDEKFALTTNRQDAIFYLLQGQIGGPGSVAVFDVQTGQIKMWDNKPMYVGSKLESHVSNALSPYKCISGNPVIRVAANIVLEEKTYENDSVPGGSTMSYYEVLLPTGEVNEMNVKADPC